MRKPRPRVRNGIPSMYVDTKGLHYHQCADCRTIWQHPEGGGNEECNIKRHGRRGPHKCPKPKCHGYEAYKLPLVEVTKIDYPWEIGKEDDPNVGQRRVKARQ